MILRYYQRDAKEAVEWSWEQFMRVGLKLPTGSGKNVVISKLFESMQPGRCLFLADQDELCSQPRAVIQRSTGIIPALEKAKDKASLEAKIVVASSQSLARIKRLERYPRNHFDYIISDEFHRGTDRDVEIWDYFETARTCGMTATPFRANMVDMSKWLSKWAYEMDIIDLVEEGFAPPPKLLNLPVEIDLSKVTTKRGFEGKEYDLESVDSTITPWYGQIAELVREHALGRHGIAYLPLIRSSIAFAGCLRAVGLRAVHIDGESTNRDAIIESFSRGEIDWLCNSSLLSTGVDLPICDCFLNLRLTQSRAWYQQARGRAMRVLPNIIDHMPERGQASERRKAIAASSKPNALLFDLLLQNDRLGIAHASDDFCRNEHDAKALFERGKDLRNPFEIAAAAKAVQAEREAALVAALERAAVRSGLNTPLTGNQVAALLGELELLDYVPIERWELEPPTAKQIETLHSKGVECSSIKSKGEASQLIDLLCSRASMGYASVKQVKIIKQMDELKPPELRHEHPEKLSSADASAMIDAEFKARRRAA